MTVEETAQAYLEKGFSIIPITGPAYTYGKDDDEKYRNSKKPLLKSWKDYQTRRATREEIQQWFKEWPDANIAIITGEISGVDVLDCDSTEATIKMGEYYKGTTPVARNKKGGHLYFKHYPGMNCHNRFMKGEDFDLKAEGGYVIAPPSKVCGSDVSYEWVRSCFDHAFDSLDSILFFDFLYRVNQGSYSTFYSNQQVLHDSTMWEYGKRDDSLFHTALCLVKGGMRKEEIFQVLKPIMGSWGETDDKWINTKIESAIHRAEMKERNLAQEIIEWVDSTTGNFYSTEIEKVLHCSTTKDKKNVHIILKRLSEKDPPLIEKVPGRNGHWRKIDTDLQYINWQDAEESEYPIQLPLNIHQLVKLYPGNIAILAGASNTGKTSFMLETIRLNQRQHPVTYLNSEMAAPELRLRLKLFEDIISLDKWKFRAIERSSNFADVIDPDGFNVIDFMEIYDEFWKIGGWIRDIHLKLKKGIAIIAIQKKGSTKKTPQDFARGGELTLEKPRLYLAMDRGKIKIVKAKIWRSHERNPNGLIREFNIINGWKFKPKDEWYSEQEEKYRDFLHED